MEHIERITALIVEICGTQGTLVQLPAPPFDPAVWQDALPARTTVLADVAGMALTPDGKIREKRSMRCPLCAAANEINPEFKGKEQVKLPAGILDLEMWQEASFLVSAADNKPGHDSRLRARLLRVCGIEGGV